MEINSLDTRSTVVGWPVFRDGPISRFLCIWLEAQIARLGHSLETVSEPELKKVQGQITALRMVRTFLDSRNIEKEISDLTKK